MATGNVAVKIVATVSPEARLHLWKQQALTRLVSSERALVTALQNVRDLKEQLKSLGN